MKTNSKDVNEEHLAFCTAKAHVYYANVEMASALQAYLLKNRERFASFEPTRPTSYFDLADIKSRLATAMSERQTQHGLSLIIMLPSRATVIGRITFSNVVKGAFQACHLGFDIDADYEGQSIMSTALQSALVLIHDEYGLHRVMANHLPDNHRSKALLARLGFEREGYAKSYLHINGRWQDHVLNSYVF